MDTCAIKNGTRSIVPRVPFSRIKDEILGAEYQLSLVFIGDTKMRRLNSTYRHKDATTDILSFPLSKNSGEIFFSPREVKKRAPRFHLSTRDHFVFLFIHGCLHLKGMQHGRTMERLEDSWCAHFGFKKPQR
jgi:probable rRNA maturation factor